MRLRAGLILFFLLLLTLVVGGCRKPLAPTFDRNQAPETWITAAPLDTITYRDGTTPKQTDPKYIPFRYHLYWAGSDPDGKVAGFYFAVVETLPIPIAPAVNPPPLPGPKARDYHFTSKTDSTFIFSVSDFRTDRQHAFFIYAVDNQGKPDPTPARFIFKSIDRYPPLAVIDRFVSSAFIWTQDPNTLALTRIFFTDSLSPSDTFKLGTQPKRTLPNQSRLDIAWHSEITTTDNPAVGYRYRLDEPEWVNVGVSTTTLSYNTGPGDAVGPGVKVFRLRALDQAGGVRDPEATRFFQMNIPPTTWIAGADPAAPVWTHGPNNETFVTITNWAAVPNLAGASLLSSDSTKVMPSQRPPRRNFLEIFRDVDAPSGVNRDRIYVRQDGDTVNMNSWVIVFSGGFDPDSPYNVTYRSNDPLAPDSTGNPVLQVRPSNGSPVGFRSRVPVFLSPTGPLTGPSQSGLYPVFDPASVFRAPAIGSYNGMSQSGTAYLFTRAEDGNGQLDPRVGAPNRPDLLPQAIVYAVDSTGSANADQVALRPLILRFFVNKAPQLQLTAPAYSPKPNTTSPSRLVSLNLPSRDVDPLDPSDPPPVGRPSTSAVFRYQLKFRGPRNGGAAGDSVTFAPPALDRVATVPTTVSLPDSLGGTQVRVMIELCDCAACENVPGQGRCSYYSYMISVPAPPEPQLGSAMSGSGPGQAALEDKKRGQR